MNTRTIGIIGAGGNIARTAYLPEIRRRRKGEKGILTRGSDCRDPIKGAYPSIKKLIGRNNDQMWVLTPPPVHFPNIQELMNHGYQGPIAVEKPVCPDAQSLKALQTMLTEDPNLANNFLAVDHWALRVIPLMYALKGEKYIQEHFPWFAPKSQSINVKGSFETIHNIPPSDIEKIKGYLIEPSDLDNQGNPIALNFQTKQPDNRTFNHPNGVVLDTATHPLALIGELLSHLGRESSSLEFNESTLTDRLGNPIIKNDFLTAEGQASLKGQYGGVPIEIEVNKYGGDSEEKGITIFFNNGQQLTLHRENGCEVVTLSNASKETLGTLTLPMNPYQLLIGSLLDPPNVFSTIGHGTSIARQLTNRRIKEIEQLLEVHTKMRGRERLRLTVN